MGNTCTRANEAAAASKEEPLVDKPLSITEAPNKAEQLRAEQDKESLKSGAPSPPASSPPNSGASESAAVGSASPPPKATGDIQTAEPPPPPTEGGVSTSVTGGVSQGTTVQEPAKKKIVLEEVRRRRLSVAAAAPSPLDRPESPNKPENERGSCKIVRSFSTDITGCGRKMGGRMSVSGRQGGRQSRFERKPEEITGSERASLGIGHVCRKGWKPESPNQDDFFIYVVDDVKLFGVFDGHGPCGDDVSNFVQQNVGRMLYEHPSFGTDYGTALTECFAKIQEMIREKDNAAAFDASLSGCTATVVIHDASTHTLVSAHVGDSRAVLGVKNPANPGELNTGKNFDYPCVYKTIELTEDHKPTLPGEEARIRAHGGEVKRLRGDIPHRVFLLNKPIPGLAMSRALGDFVAERAGVIAVPEITTRKLDPAEEPLLIVCSDGVWEFIVSAEAVQLVAEHSDVQAAAEELAKISWRRWLQMEDDVVDDITVQIAQLYPKASTPTAAAPAKGATSSAKNPGVTPPPTVGDDDRQATPEGPHR